MTFLRWLWWPRAAAVWSGEKPAAQKKQKLKPLEMDELIAKSVAVRA
uniref:DNA replication n=1 Tax=Klebsiella pneumoniae TaxID=573 RepID=A0A8B0SWM3_KLEPN|nr:DNA replication [Klebsiella pneumoniae]